MSAPLLFVLFGPVFVWNVVVYIRRGDRPGCMSSLWGWGAQQPVVGRDVTMLLGNLERSNRDVGVFSCALENKLPGESRYGFA